MCVSGVHSIIIMILNVALGFPIYLDQFLELDIVVWFFEKLRRCSFDWEHVFVHESTLKFPKIHNSKKSSDFSDRMMLNVALARAIRILDFQHFLTIFEGSFSELRRS